MSPADPNLDELKGQVAELKQLLSQMTTKREQHPMSDIRCYNCQKMGHMARNCRDKRARRRYEGREKTHDEKTGQAQEPLN